MSLLKAIEANKKRKRVELRIEQKWEIIEQRRKFPKLSQTQLIVHLNRIYDMVISKQTMSDILKPEYERKLQKLDSVEDYNTSIRDGNTIFDPLIEFKSVILRKISGSRRKFILNNKDFSRADRGYFATPYDINTVYSLKK